MLPESALTSMNVLFATPCYISNVTMNYVVSLFDLIRESTRLGLNFNLHLHSESLVTRARNEIVKYRRGVGAVGGACSRRRCLRAVVAPAPLALAPAPVAVAKSPLALLIASCVAG